MALASYTDLVGSLSPWLDGSDLGGREGDMITLTTAAINDALGKALGQGARIRPMMVRSNINISAEYSSIETNSAVILAISLEVTSLDQPWKIDYVSPEHMVAMGYGQDNTRASVGTFISGGPPRYYTVIADELRFFPAPQDTTFTAEFTRYEALVDLSGDNPANWVLSHHPNVYLYGALAQAELFGWNDARMANVATLASNAMDALISRYPVQVDRTPLATEAAMLGANAGNGLTLSTFIGGRF